MAVLVVIIAVVSIGRSLHPSSAGPVPAAAPGPVTAGPPISSYVASGQVPRYYVAIKTRIGDPSLSPGYAVVAETASGKTLATIQPSVPHGTILAVTAAADDRTFVLDEERWSTNAASLDDGARTFYEFRLNSSGRPGPLTRLPMSVPNGYQLDGLALSPDGGKLAVALEPATNTRPVLSIVKVYTLATGAVRTWTGHGGSIGSGTDDARSLSWTSDGQTLAFDWSANSGVIQGGAGGVRLLRVDAADSNLLTAGPPAVPAGHPSPQSRPPACNMDLIITPDGSKIVCGAIQIQIRGGVLLSSVTQFREYSTATGQVTPILGFWKFHSVSPNIVGVLWSNASGSVLIGVIPGGGHGRIGVISGNSFTPLPAAAISAASVAAADDQSGTW